MMTTGQSEQVELRPFHETVVEAMHDAIRYNSLNTITTITALLRLIEKTLITDGYDEILEFLKNQLGGDNLWELELSRVKLVILAQKQAAEAATTDFRQSFHFDGKERALMIVIEKIIKVLRTLPYTGEQDNENLAYAFKLFETAKKISRAKDEKEFKGAIVGL